MPDNTVKVDRSTKWGNPFVIGEHVPPNTFVKSGRWFVVEDASMAVMLFRHFILRTTPDGYEGWHSFETIIGRNIHLLRGKTLACWCKLGDPCHADVLLELANK